MQNIRQQNLVIFRHTTMNTSIAVLLFLPLQSSFFVITHSWQGRQ